MTLGAGRFCGRDGRVVAFFGFVAGHESEFGNFLLSELEAVRSTLGFEIERDLAFTEGRFTDVVPAPDS